MGLTDKLPTYGSSYFAMFMKVMKAWVHIAQWKMSPAMQDS